MSIQYRDEQVHRHATYQDSWLPGGKCNNSWLTWYVSSPLFLQKWSTWCTLSSEKTSHQLKQQQVYNRRSAVISTMPRQHHMRSYCTTCPRFQKVYSQANYSKKRKETKPSINTWNYTQVRKPVPSKKGDCFSRRIAGACPQIPKIPQIKIILI